MYKLFFIFYSLCLYTIKANANPHKFLCYVKDSKMYIADSENNFTLLEGYERFDTWLSDDVYTISGRSKHGTKIKPNTVIMPVENGFDIRLDFYNNRKDTASIGEFFIGNFKLDQKVYYRNTNYTFREDTLFSKLNTQLASPSRIYPSTSCYSPVTVLRDDKYIVGITMTYPIEEYKHTANHMFFGNFFDYGRFGWNMIIQVNKAGNGQKYYPSGELAPGQRRIYNLHIRVGKVKNIEEDWKAVIQPYKAYFEARYKQSYKKDSRPIIGYVGVNETRFSNTNPYGYTNLNNDRRLTSHPLRPDIYGFSPFTKYVRSLASQKNAKRVMVWAPSGIYKQHQHLNYPYQFATHLLTIGKAKSQLSRKAGINDPIKNYKTLSNQLAELGMWWGHAGQVSYAWDDGFVKPFNTQSSRDWNVAFAELDAAMSMGVNCLGLDTFSEMDGWDQVTWLKEMKKRSKSKIKFVSELYSFDIIHANAVFMYAGWNCNSRHFLADYLVPDNEKWMLISAEKVPDQNKYIKKISGWNYVPCVISYYGDRFNQF